MKRAFSLILMLLLILSCFGCSNNSNSNSSGTNTQNATDNSQGTSDSSSTTDNSSSSSTDSKAVNASVVGDWEFHGTVDSKSYDINFDLESNNQFEMDVEEETSEDDVDAELKGTYTDESGVLTLDVATLQNPKGYFSGTVVENSQIKLNYKLIDANTLEISNASDVISFIPAELTLTRD